MTRVLCLALLLACGADEGTRSGGEATERSGETEAAPEGRVREGAEATAEAGAPRPNRSAGPARAGFQVVPQRMHRRSVTTITIFGSHAAAGTARGMVTIFDVPSGHVRAARRLFFGAVDELRVSDDRKRILALGSGTGEDDTPVEAVVWDLEVDRVWPVPNDYSYIRAMSPDGRYVATIPAQTGDEPAEVELAEVFGGDSRTRRLDDTIGDVFFSSDSRTLFVLGDGQLRRLGVPGLRPRGDAWPASGSLAARNPSGDLVALLGNTSVSIRSLEDGEEKAELTAPDRVNGVQWSPDGSRLAVNGRRGRIFSGDDWATTQDFTSGSRLDLVSDTPASLVRASGKIVYTPVDGSDPFELEPELHQGVAFPLRAGWFLYGHQGDVYIANVERQRSRRLVRGGSGERSAWGASVDDSAITLHGRGWSERFGEAAPEAESAAGAAAEAPMPDFPGYEQQPYVERMASSTDGKLHVVLVDPTGDAKPFLVNRGGNAPIPLREPAGREGFGIYCGLDYDEEYGEETYYCEQTAEFAPNAEWFVVGGAEATASFDASGRRLGTTGSVRWVRFVGDDKALIHTPNGALLLTGKDLHESGVLFRARERMSAFATTSDDQRWVAAVRGAALAIYDVTANERKHVITLPARAMGSPVFVGDGLVQVRVQGAFVWYRLEAGDQARKVELDHILAIDDERTHALTCGEDRLRHVTLADPEQSKDLGPCPLDAREVGFDHERVWWVEGSRAHVVRLSDAEHLIVGAYLLRRPLRYAFTPRGHFWTNRPDALRSLRVRMPGPVLDADTPVPEAAWVRESLIGDFLADRDLGDAPER